MPDIEAIGIARPQCANPNRHPLCICIGKHNRKNGSADSLALMRGQDAEVVKEKMVGLMAHHNKADPVPLDDQVLGA